MPYTIQKGEIQNSKVAAYIETRGEKQETRSKSVKSAAILEASGWKQEIRNINSFVQ